MTPDNVPAVGFGTYRLDPATCEDAVATALDAGYRHVDTAEMYDNEAAVGDAVAASSVDREAVFVATKLHSEHLAYDDAVAHAEACRDRLGLDAIDLLYVHWPINTYDPEETLAALDDLHDRGLARHVGVSNFTPALLADAIDRLDAPLHAHQVECHPLLPQAELRAMARDHDHALVAYSPLAKGRVFDVPELRAVADKHDATPAQVSLAWLLSKGVAVVPRSSNPAHVRENYAARDLDLDAGDVARVDAIDRRERQVDFPGAPWN
ncbi:aldo/keto reductase [Halobacterium yunchengense]|uniref:aldo/keto reductase n=1 Tax=Halobacterium yunchengense TaxID=3108497 RepID=UPI003008EE77